MNESVGLEWLDENFYRAYPLTSASNATVALDGATIEFKYILLDANFVYSTQQPNRVLLENVQRNGDVITFTVTGLPTFELNVNGPFPSYCYNSNFDLLVISAMALNIPDGADIILTDVEFEPVVATELSGEYQGVNGIAFNGETIAAGVITLVEGYQTSLNINGQTINVNIGRNEGIPLPCQDFFSLASDCSNVISFLNGTTPIRSGGIVKLKAGSNVKIFEDPEVNRIYIGLDFATEDNCQTTELPPTQTV